MGPRVKESDKVPNHEHRPRARKQLRVLRVRKQLVDIEDLNMDQLSLSRHRNNVNFLIERRCQRLRPRLQLLRLQWNTDHFLKRASPEFQNKIEQLMRVQKEAAGRSDDEKLNAAKQDVMEELIKKMELAFSEPEDKLAAGIRKMSLH